MEKIEKSAYVYPSKKIKKKRGPLQRLRRNVGWTGKVLEKLNVEFKDVVEQMSTLDERIRESGEGLEIIIKGARSLLRRREYFAAASNIVQFHRQLNTINANLKLFSQDLIKNHRRFFLRHLSPDDLKQLSGKSYDPKAKIQTKPLKKEPEPKKINNKPLMEQLKAAGLNKEYQMIVEANFVGDWWHNIFNDPGRAMKAMENKFSNSFLTQLKQATKDLVGKSEEMFKTLLDIYDELGDAWAARKVGEYVEIGKRFSAAFDNYHEAFLAYYDEYVIPLQKEHAEMEAEEKQKEELAKKQEEAPTGVSDHQAPFNVPDLQMPGPHSPSSFNPYSSVSPSEIDRIDNGWGSESVKSNRSPSSYRESEIDRILQQPASAAAPSSANSSAGSFQLGQFYGNNKRQVQKKPPSSNLPFDLTRKKVPQDRPTDKDLRSRRQEYYNQMHGTDMPPYMVERPESFKWRGNLADPIKFPHTLQQWNQGPRTNKNFPAPPANEPNIGPTTLRSIQSPKGTTPNPKRSYQEFIDGLEKLATTEEIVSDILQYSEELENSDPQKGLELLAIAEGMLQVRAVEDKKKDKIKFDPIFQAEQQLKNKPYLGQPFQHNVPEGHVNRRFSHFPNVNSNIALTMGAQGLLLKHINNALKDSKINNPDQPANIDILLSKAIMARIIEGLIVRSQKCSLDGDDCFLKVYSHIDLGNIYHEWKGKMCHFEAILRMDGKNGNTSFRNISQMEILNKNDPYTLEDLKNK